MISSDFSWRFLELFESAQISTVVCRIYRLFQAISPSNPEVQNWAEIHTGTEPLWKPAEIVLLLIIIIKYIPNMLPMLNSGIDLPFGMLPTLDSMRIWGYSFLSSGCTVLLYIHYTESECCTEPTEKSTETTSWPFGGLSCGRGDSVSNLGLPSVASTGGDDQRLMRCRTLTRGRGIPLQHNRTEKLSSPKMMITMLTKKVPRRSESNRPSSSDLLTGTASNYWQKNLHVRPCDFSSTAAWPSHGVLFSKTSQTNQKKWTKTGALRKLRDSNQQCPKHRVIWWMESGDSRDSMSTSRGEALSKLVKFNEPIASTYGPYICLHLAISGLFLV